MIMRIASVALVGLFLIVPARAAELYSRTFTMSGRCDGGDMVYSWNGGSGSAPKPTEYGAAFIYPWLDSAIVIRGVEVVITSPARWWSLILGPPYFGFLMVGNDAWEDIMLMMGSDTLRAVNMFPDGRGFMFPGKKNMTPLTYIDLHGSCRWPRKAQVLITIYYSPADQ
jgi:hypothetical protein